MRSRTETQCEWCERNIQREKDLFWYDSRGLPCCSIRCVRWSDSEEWLEEGLTGSLAYRDLDVGIASD